MSNETETDPYSYTFCDNLEMLSETHNMTRENIPAPTAGPTVSTRPKPPSITQLTRNPPKLTHDVWEYFNTEVSTLNKESWYTFKKGITTPEQYISDLNGMLASFLESNAEFQKEAKQYYKHNPINSDPLEQMRKEKYSLNKQAKKPNASETIKEQARQSIRAYSHMLKVHKEKKEESLKRQQDKSYRTEFWKTAKNVTNGIYGIPESAPTYNKAIADEFYKNQYENPIKVNLDKLDWFPSVEPPKVPYNLSAFKPKNIKSALAQKDKKSSPGYDGIVYE